MIDHLDAWQRRRRLPAFVVGVVRKSSDDRAGALAALIAHYAFFAVFPLLLVLATLTDRLLADHPDLRERVLDSAVSQFPVIGTDLQANVGRIGGSGLALVAGLLTALWAGLGIGRGLQHASDTVWSVPVVERPLLLAARVRAVAVVVILGVALVLASVASGVVAGVGGASLAARVLGALGAFTLVVATLLGVFRALAPSLPWRELWPGAAVAAVGWAALQVLGVWFVDRVVSRAGDTYGVFAVVIGLLVWLSLLARMLVIGAEVNVVRARRLWPRSLLGPPMASRSTPADEEAYRLQALAERRTPDEEVTAAFGGRRPPGDG